MFCLLVLHLNGPANNVYSIHNGLTTLNTTSNKVNSNTKDIFVMFYIELIKLNGMWKADHKTSLKQMVIATLFFHPASGQCLFHTRQ